MRIIGKELLVEQSPVLLKLPLHTPEELSNFEVGSGSWAILDGALQGEYRENGGGMIYTKESFPGDVMMDFYGELVPPCENDLNFVFKTEGYNHAGQDAGRGYIAGLNGWWEHKAGMEKYPECVVRAQTPLFRAQTGVRYHIQAGCAAGHCFIFVDGRLILEMLDSSPEDLSDCGRVGFGVYCSKARYTELTVYGLRWKPWEGFYYFGAKSSQVIRGSCVPE